MIIAFTARQMAAVDRRLSGHPVLLVETLTDRHRYADSGWQVDSPYSAWVTIREVLLGGLFGPHGGRRHDVPRTLGIATRRIVTAVNAMDRHPALRRMAAVGSLADVIPAWELDEVDEWKRVYSPTPCDGRFVILKPTWHFEMNLTTWGSDGLAPQESRLYDEALHRRFS